MHFAQPTRSGRVRQVAEGGSRERQPGSRGRLPGASRGRSASRHRRRRTARLAGALLCAAASGSALACETLLAAGADIEQKNGTGDTALLVAVMHGNAHAAQARATRPAPRRGPSTPGTVSPHRVRYSGGLVPHGTHRPLHLSSATLAVPARRPPRRRTRMPCPRGGAPRLGFALTARGTRVARVQTRRCSLRGRRRGIGTRRASTRSRAPRGTATCRCCRCCCLRRGEE